MNTRHEFPNPITKALLLNVNSSNFKSNSHLYICFRNLLRARNGKPTTNNNRNKKTEQNKKQFYIMLLFFFYYSDKMRAVGVKGLVLHTVDSYAIELKTGCFFFVVVVSLRRNYTTNRFQLYRFSMKHNNFRLPLFH